MNRDTTVTSNRLWGYSILLTLPAFVVYICHFMVGVNGEESLATGYIHYDMPYYVANALEYKKSEDFLLAFSLPFTDRYHSERIYFYPQLFLLGLVMRYTPLPPVAVYLLFGIVCAVLTIRIGLQLLLRLLAMKGHAFAFVAVLFGCGGGIFFLSGFAYSLLEGVGVKEAILSGFRWDPGGGWWFLNLGRNFIFPNEAYVHFVFLTTVFLLHRKNYLAATFMTVLMAASHPFTGSALLTIVIAWYLLEIVFMRNTEIKALLPVILIVCLTIFLYYNFIFLPSHEEHRVLMEQWTIDWSTGLYNYFLGYLLVLIPAVIRLSSGEKRKAFISIPFNRFLLVWLVINVALENHDLFMKPLQPLHFSRGYVWINLFLIGLPVIYQWISRMMEVASPVKKAVLLVVVLGVGISDNGVWMTMLGYGQVHGGGLSVTKSQKEVLEFLHDNFRHQELLVSQDERIGYMALVYTSYRTYISHPYNTPYIEEKRANLKGWLEQCIEPRLNTTPSRIWVIYGNRQRCDWLVKGEKVFGNGVYEVWRE